MKDLSTAIWEYVRTHPRLISTVVVLGVLGIVALYALRGMWV